MISQFEQLIIDITDELQCSPEEKHDIQMELRDHLYTSYEHYEVQGMLSEEAIQHVVAEFGQKNIVSEQLQLAVNPLFGLTKKIVWIVFIAYSVIVFWKVMLSRLVLRILDYVRASEPYYFSFVRNDPRTLEHKQVFDFSLWEQNLNLQPLKSIFFYVTTDRVNFNIIIDNLLGNIILLLPLGLLLPFLFKKCKTFYTVLAIAFFTSYLIELLQFSLQIGIADIDDIILNTIGTMLGYGLAMLIFKLFVWRRRGLNVIK